MTTPLAHTSQHRSIDPKVLYFGTPVVVLSSLNADGTTNLAPISSMWALGGLLVIGLGADGQTARNVRRHPEIVVNYCWDHQWAQVESLALLTGANPVPSGKPAGAVYEPDKFAAAGWTASPSSTVAPARVEECGAHVEAVITAMTEADEGVVIVQARAVAIDAHESIIVPGSDHIDPNAWHPLIYNFRHYYPLGERLGIARRAEVQTSLAL